MVNTIAKFVGWLAFTDHHRVITRCCETMQRRWANARERQRETIVKGLLAAIISTGLLLDARLGTRARGKRERGARMHFPRAQRAEQQRRRGFNYNAIFARPFETLLGPLRSNARSNHASIGPAGPMATQRAATF